MGLIKFENISPIEKMIDDDKINVRFGWPYPLVPQLVVQCIIVNRWRYKFFSLWSPQVLPSVDTIFFHNGDLGIAFCFFQTSDPKKG